MIKIFVTGFQHSGTTMLMQLLNAHPQVGKIENEEGYVEFNKSRQWVLMHASRSVQNLKKHAWGEKIPWGTKNKDVDGKRAIIMIKRWMKLFKHQARVLHLVRHPIDVALSGGHIQVGERNWKFITTTVPIVIDFINKHPRCATVVYEDLLLDPHTHLREMFKWLGLRYDAKTIDKVANTELKFGKINPDRAFAYKNKNIKLEVDYDKLLEKVKVRL